jgi:lipopolysaccharide biosynthesis regulator YciM
MRIAIHAETIGNEIIRGISVNSEIAVKTDQIKRVLKYFRQAIECEKENPAFNVVVRNEVKQAYKMLIEWESFINWLSENSNQNHPHLETGKRHYKSLKKVFLIQAKRFIDLTLNPTQP